MKKDAVAGGDAKLVDAEDRLSWGIGEANAL
jgi:hypothetical protein